MPYAIIFTGYPSDDCDGKEEIFIFEGKDKNGVTQFGDKTLSLGQIAEYVVMNEYKNIQISKHNNGEDPTEDGDILAEYDATYDQGDIFTESEKYYFTKSDIIFDIRSDEFIETLKNLML